ncbi:MULTISPECIES: class I SAM-dependent methyltransferase [unclassified Streptomyces]|uniref:class I SAM-dependent methyltransferase n=1 Tax=unclassified Streptomyces TaxID=2593676 RepID=UPI00068FF46C|nr:MULTISPECIES: class I SAM-dependent methyltransferase [unclassified Streptomyces]
MARLTAAALGAGFTLNAVRLNRRLAGLRLLEPSADPSSPDFRFVLASGVRLDDATRRAACAFASREGLQVLDLLPGDLPTAELLEFARLVNTRSFRRDRLAFGRSAQHAVVVEAAVLERLGTALPAGTDLAGLSAAELTGLLGQLKKCAPDTTGFAVAPGLRSVRRTARERVAARPGDTFVPLSAALAARLAAGALTFACLATAPAWGAAALAGYALQPALVRGRRFAPADRYRATWLRPVLGPGDWLRTARAAHALRGPADPHAGLRAEYQAEIARGVERFFEPRRGSCPWCGSSDLRHRVTARDMYQGKPGRFTLEECGDCGHTFQNPRLSPAGLDFYYRDCYDGIGERQMEKVFALQGSAYRDRARLPHPHTTPRTWLDVGAGHGHFCLVAQDVWPQTVFHGLDRSDAVERAEQYGWVHRGHRGDFPELAASLEAAYDVVSMFHYLEHTLDPRAELDAARDVLKPGGHLLIEVPDPQSSLSRLLGRHWIPWMQPQHVHLMPFANLRQALLERGFTMVREQRVTGRPGGDFCGAVVERFRSWTPSPRHPWSRTPPTRTRALAHAAIWTCSVPLIAAAAAADIAIAPFLGALRGGQAYRILARKEGWRPSLVAGSPQPE